MGWRLKSPASRLFTQPFIRAQIKENIKARVTGLCAGNSPRTGEFPAQMASNAEYVSIWWRHHGASHHWCRVVIHFLTKVCSRIIPYSDVIMRAMTSEIIGVSIICATVCWGAHQRKHQSSASLAFVMGNHRRVVDSPHKGVNKNAENVSIWWRHHVSWIWNPRIYILTKMISNARQVQ